jgi:ribonucleoside-diphosphate reductase large chain|nr:MAG TPA: ribonucleotide-diphosphate reductase subunit alpha [Caudoviricetes sp.]
MHIEKQQEDFYWLNEESKTFLSRGYIPDGMTVQQRYRQIADAAENILNIPGFSDKFYNYLAKGYYSLSSPIIANFGLKRALPISCVTGDTWINTANGGKMAKDIQVGDMVLTHKNRYRKVVDIIPTKDKNDIYELTVKSRQYPLNITGNHLVLTNKGWVAVEDLDPQVHLVATNGKVEYTSVDTELKNKPGESKSQEELAYDLGVSIANDVVINNDAEAFNDWVLSLPEHLLRQVWAGIEEELLNKYSDEYKVIYCAAAPVAMQLYALAKRIGVELTTSTVGRENTETGETLQLTVISLEDQKVSEDGLHYSPITRLVKTDKVEDVYDFTVEEDHSFSCAGVVVHNCFGSYITDDLNGIFDTVSEVAMMNKLGGGTSGYFGAIRARGSEITAGGKSNGTFSFLQIFDKVVSVVNQNGIRRGMFAGYIDIDHADIEEWVDIHTEGNPVQDIYWGVNVTNSFIEKVKNGDKAARNLWAKILSVKTATGIPYLHFIDNVNENKADVYLDKNMKIHASNMCVSADTKILTKEYGYVAIGTKAGEKVTVWNGEEWSENVELVKTGENQKLYAVTLHMSGYHTGKSGKFKTTIRATDYHKWYVQDKDGDIICKRTSELSVNDVTETWNSHLKEDAKVPGWVIESITEVDGLHDTYCCTEPKRNKVIFNGVLTGNCMEISLPSSADESFVCCLMSMNLLHYDKWKDTDAVKTAVYFLDAVMSEFIEKAKVIPKMEKAVRFAERHRALGLGVLGWHSYLQSKMIPFDGFEAMMKNAEIFKHIREESYQGSKELAELLGEPELLKGYGRRNTTLMAVAPTKSSSFILGQVSQGVEPIKANLFIKDTAKVKTVFKNPFLEKLLAERGKDTPEVWESINKAGGSVAHLDFLTPREKDVFKTFEEINQMSIIQQAAQRQQFIDQGQSINLSIHPDTPLKDINALYLQAMELGVKGIYYQFSKSAAQSFNRELLQCSSCEA